MPCIRDLMTIVEGQKMVDAMKAWLHPATGRVIEQGAMERHPEYVAENPQAFGLTVEQIPIEFGAYPDLDAIEAMMQRLGWVRVSNYNDAELSMAQVGAEDRGLICAASERDARWALRWLLSQRDDLVPAAVDMEVAGQLMRLNDPEAMRVYAARGIRPR